VIVRAQSKHKVRRIRFFQEKIAQATSDIQINDTFVNKKLLYHLLARMENSQSNEYVRGTLKTVVLNLLSENGRMYGYEITQEVKERTKGEIQVTFGALYPILHKLELDGLVETESEQVDGRTRKYYSLSQEGNQLADLKTLELQRFMEAMSSLLKPKTVPSPIVK
jgi:DNA-binding PadR family transcriptional regulator